MEVGTLHELLSRIKKGKEADFVKYMALTNEFQGYLPEFENMKPIDIINYLRNDKSLAGVNFKAPGHLLDEALPEVIEYTIPEVPKKESKKKPKLTLSKNDLKRLGIPYKKLKLKANKKGEY